MRVYGIFCLLGIATVPFQTHAQSDKPAQRKDSVTVSAGIPREQLVLEEKLDALVAQRDSLLRSGNLSDAVKQYQNALDLVEKQPLLAERERWVQHKLADGYARADSTRGRNTNLFEATRGKRSGLRCEIGASIKLRGRSV